MVEPWTVAALQLKFSLQPSSLLIPFVALTSALAQPQERASEPETATHPVVERIHDSATVANGQARFTQHCAACHALAQEGFGPPLGGVTRLFTEPDLLDRIRNSSKVLASGDARTEALVRRYKTIMPPFEQLAETDL